MKARLEDFMVHAFMVLATGYVVCGNIYLALQARLRPIAIPRAAGVVAITFVAITAVYAAYVVSLRRSYEHRSALSTNGYRMHLHALALAVVVYLLLAVLSGGWTRIAWPLFALPMQFLWWLALSNVVIAVVLRMRTRADRA